MKQEYLMLLLLFTLVTSNAQQPFSYKYKNQRSVRTTNYTVCQQENFDNAPSQIDDDSIGLCRFDIKIYLQRPPDAQGNIHDIPSGLQIQVWDDTIKIADIAVQDSICFIENLVSNTEYLLTINGPLPEYNPQDIANIIAIKTGKIQPAAGVFQTRSADADTDKGVWGVDANHVARAFMYKQDWGISFYEILDIDNLPSLPFGNYQYKVTLSHDIKKTMILIVRGDTTY